MTKARVGFLIGRGLRYAGIAWVLLAILGWGLDALAASMVGHAIMLMLVMAVIGVTLAVVAEFAIVIVPVAAVALLAAPLVGMAATQALAIAACMALLAAIGRGWEVWTGRAWWNYWW
jgi:hypothetical protein